MASVEVPLLEGWTAATKVARDMGVSRNTVYYMITVSQKFRTARRLELDEDRFIYVIRTSEATRVAKAYLAEVGAREELAGPRRRDRVRRDLIRAWGVQNGFTNHQRGYLPENLLAAFDEAHPDGVEDQIDEILAQRPQRVSRAASDDNAAVRAWAAANNIELLVNQPIPKEVIAAYKALQGTNG